MRPTGAAAAMNDPNPPSFFAKYGRYIIYPMIFFMAFNMVTRNYTGETRDALGEDAELVAPLTASERAVELKARRDEYEALVRNVSALMADRAALLRDVADIKSSLSDLKQTVREESKQGGENTRKKVRA